MATTVTSKHVSQVNEAVVRRYTVDWTSASDGTYSEAINSGETIAGEIVRVVFNPGSTAPTANYDITITDAQGFDVLAGQGANLSATDTTNVAPGVPVKDGTTTSVGPMIVCDVLTLSITNAGASKNGTVVLYVR